MEKAIPATNLKAASLLNSMADAFESCEYRWGQCAFYQTNEGNLEFCAIAAARFEIAGKPVEVAGLLARNEEGPRSGNPAYSKLLGIFVGEDLETFGAAVKALIAVDPSDRTIFRFTLADYRVTEINDRLESREQAVAWIRRAARYAASFALLETATTPEPARAA